MEKVHITCLPNEIMCMILQNNDYRDVIRLGLTCKHFNALVNNQYIWKDKIKTLLPKDIFTYVEANNHGNWLGDFKRFFQIGKQVYHEIMGMSAKYFNRLDDINFSDVRMIFNIGMIDNTSYYYVIHILQQFANNTYQSMHHPFQKSFTLTEVYYAKTALRYLLQTYLTLKWAQGHLRNELKPQIVLNFFIQWIDPLHFHWEEDVEHVVNTLVEKVGALLPTDEHSTEPLSVPERINKGLITHKLVLSAISDVIYKQPRMAVMTQANLDTLDIIKIMKNRCAHPVALAAIFYAVAKKCGVDCDLVAFPHHFILEWRNTNDPAPHVEYKVVLDTGELTPKGQCPFSSNFVVSHNTSKYCPEAFLQYAVTAYLSTQGLISDWYTQCSTQLLNFLNSNRSNRNDNNPYRHFLLYLINNTQIPAVKNPVNFKVMKDYHRDMIQALTLLNPSPPPLCRDVVVKHRNSSVKYAVGMICYHTKYDYMCVIRGWNLSCSEDHGVLDLNSLRLGPQQPFYNIVAADQSSRYVAQENLVEIRQPSRVYHLEYVISREFSHFDGFFYVPNYEKNNEYPEDGPIREIFRTRAEQRI